MLSLRLLDPLTDQHLYRTAYHWRQPKKHLQLGRMSFEVFASDDPSHITFGLFDDKFIGLYFLHELEPRVYQVHMASKRHVPRETLLAGAQRVAETMLQCGAEHLVAILNTKNTPLCRFVEALGFKEEKGCQIDTPSGMMPSDTQAVSARYILSR